ncbi:MAG: RHS repeat protein, partial [Clostridia bacterium]|nr:RHS repeat protein [Clostridia bacterium]
MTKKSLLYSLIFSLLLVLAFTLSVNASTSDSIAIFYSKRAMGLGSGYYAPNVSDVEDFVDVSRGDVVINETDYVIKGRNGFDIPIVRSYNPDRLPGFVFQFDDMGSVDKPVRIGIYYINTSNNKRILVGFKTEASAYEYRDGITGVNHQEITENDNYSDWFYAIEKLEDSAGDYFYERDTSREPILITNEVSKERGVQTYCTNDQYVNIGSGWAIAKPSAVYLYDEYKGNYYTHWLTFCDIYGKYTNIEICIYEDDDDDVDVEEFTGHVNVESHREYTSEFVNDDDISQIATHSVGFEYNYMIKDNSGLTYYFYYATRNPDAFLRGISDRFGNVFSYEEQRSGSGYFAWTDCATGIKYTISPDGIIMQNGELSTEIVSYVYSDINSDGDVGDIFSCDNQYRLTVHKNDSLSSEGTDSDNYVIYNMSKYYLMSELFCPQGGRDPIPEDLMRASHYIESIEYSNGLTKHYELIRRGTSSRCKYDVSKSYESFNDIDYNKKEYEYDGTSIVPSASNRTGSFRVDSARMNEYISGSSKKGYTNYTFDTKGRLTQKKAYQGSSRYLTEDYTYNCDCFDSPAKTVKVTKNGNITTTNTYDKYHRLTKSVYGDTQTEYIYGDNNIITESTSKKDASTIIKTVNTPTEDGKSIAESAVYENDVLKSKTTFTYNSDGTVASQSVYRTNEENVTTDYSYQYGQDGSTTVTQTVSGVTDADNANETNISTQITTDVFGNVTKTKDANGNETLFEYDLLLRPTKTTNADGSIVSVSYNDVSNETTVTDARDNSFRYKFDPWGNCIEYAYLVSGEYIPLESAEYDYAHRLNKYRRYNSGTQYYDVVYTYDKRDRVLTETVEDSSGTDISIATYTYTDTQASDYTPLFVTTMQMSDANNTFAKTEITTDYLDRTVSKKLIDTDGNARTYSYTHDYFGNVLTSTAPDNSTETYTYDHAGNVLSYTNQLGNTMTYAYDMSGLNTSVTDFMNNTTVFTYDKLGRKIKTTSPFTDTATTTSKTYYDANGNVIKEAVQISQDGFRTTDYAYDNMNRLSFTTTHPTATTSEITQYFYDKIGNVTHMFTGLTAPLESIESIPENSHYASYTYDNLNNCTSVGGTLTSYTEYEYDNSGNVISKETYDGDFSYEYDAFGNVIAVYENYELTDTFGYNAIGQRTYMNDSTGTTTYTYDDFGNLTRESKGDIVKTSTYDALGRRTGFNVGYGNSTILSNTYSYDIVGRMTSATSNGETIDYTYDYNGNLLTES